MKRIYLSHFLGPETPLYGGEGCIQIDNLRSINSGDSCNSSRCSFPNHAGTHIDLPRHFVADGKMLDDYPPDFWIFQHVTIAELGEIIPGSVIGPDLLKQFEIPPLTELLLLKTGFGRLRGTPSYWMENPVFRPELAEYLRESLSALRAIGFDTISLSSWTDRTTGRLAHRAFLSGDNPILLIEDMDLAHLDNKTIVSRVTVAPLLMSGTDASPCTIIAEVTNL
jgi:arylformamidase